MKAILIDLIPKAGKITDDISAALKFYRTKGRTQKYFQPREITINGQKYIIRADDFKASQAEQLEQGFKDLNKWKKDPTVRNWNNIFRQPSGANTAFSKNIRSYITGTKSTGGVPLTKNIKKLFDKLKVKDLIGPETKIIKDYTSDYFKKLRPLAATEAAAEKNLKASAAEVKQIAPLFKTKTKRSLEEITKKLNPKYDKANEIDKADMLQQTTNKVAKYLQFLKGERKAGKLQQPQKTDEIINWIESESSDFRFQEGIVRDMKFAARDKALGLKPGTTRAERRRLVDLTDKGFAVDEAVGLSATYKNAPGYTEATQILSKDINDLKGIQIDRVFGKVLNEVVEGNTKNVEAYNKKAKQFMKDNPNVDVPIIKTGKNLDPKKFVSYFDEYSPQAQNSILNQAKTQNFVIQTKSKPVARLLKDLRQQGYSNEEALSVIATLGTGTVGGIALTSSDALSDTFSNNNQIVSNNNQIIDSEIPFVGMKTDVEYGDPETWNKKVGQFIEESPYISGFGAAGTALQASQLKKPTTFGKFAKQIAAFPFGATLKGLGTAVTPLGLTAMTVPTFDIEDPLSRGMVGLDLALAKESVDLAKSLGSKATSNPAIQSGVTRLLNLGLSPTTALRAARFASPLGMLLLAGEGGYQFYQALEDEKARIAAMSPEERQMFEEEQTAAAYMGEAENFANGGRVGMKKGGDPKNKKKTPFDKPTLPIDPNAPQDPGRRTFMEGMGLGGLGIAGLLSGAVKFAPEIKKAVTGVTTQMTEVPNIIKELYATIKNLGQVTDYSKKGVVKTELGPYELNEYPGGYNITKMTDSDFRYQKEYFEVQTDPEYGVIDYEELTALPDMDGKLKDVDYGVELNTYREIGEDLAKIKNDDSLIKIADDDIAKQIEKEEALKESLGKKGMGEND